MSLGTKWYSAIAIGGVLLLMASCGEGPTLPSDDGESGPVLKKGGPPGGTDTPVTAVFRDAATDGVRSDYTGEYSGVIFENGRVRIDVRDGPREFCMNFFQQGPPFYEPPPDEFCDDGYLTSGPSGLLDMPIDGTPADTVTWTMRGMFYWSVPSGNKTYGRFLRFGTDCESPNNVVEENELTLRHPSADTWTIEGTDAILCRDWEGPGKPHVVWAGDFSMPFKMTLTRVP